MRGLARRLNRKQLSTPPGTGAGWGPMGRYRTGPQRLNSFIEAYGGSDNSVTWIFACISLIASTAAGYPHRLTDFDGETLERPNEDLVKLLAEPNDQQTYFDWVEAVFTDLELVGNSYWLKNQISGLKQPLELLRLEPSKVRVVKGPDGTRIGYVYEVGNLKIPYRVEEIVHYRYPNPRDPDYGMGTVEAILRAANLNISENQHLTGFFDNGARLSGILNVPETMSETQFERIREQFEVDYQGPANAYRLLIAEGSTDFKPVTTPPAMSGLVDLVRLNKDEILGGFGVPETLLGGTMENANYKMEDSQHIFTRAMTPKTLRFSERTSLDITTYFDGAWLRVDPQGNEPLSVLIEYAQSKLKAGGTIDESRRVMGEPELNLKGITDVPMVASTTVSGESVVVGRTLQAGQGQPAIGEPGLPPVEEPTTDEGTEPPNLREATSKNESCATCMHFDADSNHCNLYDFDVEPGQVCDAFEPADDAGGDVEKRRRLLRLSSGLPPWRTWGPTGTKSGDFDLPPGFEPYGPIPEGKAPAGWIDELRRDHAAVLRDEVPAVTGEMADFFRLQRARVLAKLARYRAGGELARGKLHKKDLAGGQLWDSADENQRLRDAYLPIVDRIGARALEVPKRLVGSTLNWNLENPRIASVRDRLAEKVTRINDTTRSAISDVVETGMQRGYSIPQIANGFPEEDYPGVLGVFDQASGYRAEMIARSETAMAYNYASTAAYADAGLSKVLVMDGTGDGPCADANGAEWTVDQANADPIAHPNCIRSFAPVTPGGEEPTTQGD